MTRSLFPCAPAFFLVSLAISGVAHAANPAVAWRNAGLSAPPPVSFDAAAELQALAGRPDARHVVIQFADTATTADRQALASGGVQLLSYLGHGAYFASLDAAALNAAALPATVRITGAQPIQRDWKLHPELAGGRYPAYTLVADGSQTRVAVYIKFHRDVPIVPDGVLQAAELGVLVRDEVYSVNTLVAEAPIDAIDALADLDGVQWIELALPQLSEMNNENRVITQTNIVQAAPYSLDGAGVQVLIYDAGDADDNHPDFAGRMISGFDTNIITHATHVAGTVGGSGANSGGNYRGMAPGCDLISYGFQYNGSGTFLYTNPGDIEGDYAAAIIGFGADISNNSIGTNTCANGFPCAITGDYGITDELIDEIVRGSLGGSPFRIVWANGNERGCSRCRNQGVHTPEGYHSTAPPACAKNHITVGAMNANNDSVTSFTSFGPTDDGRLKPDISAPGCQSSADFGVTSCVPGGGYGVLCGTSMASPTACGMSALLLQDFRAQFPGRPDPRNSTLKILLAQTAADIQQPGPDYRTGYGSIRIRDAVDFLRLDQFAEDDVSHGQAATRLIFVYPGSATLKLMIAWDDVPGTPNIVPSLVNDLDLIVTDPDGVRHYPWTLDPANPGGNAVRTAADHVNNIEQVFVQNPLSGLWTVQVFGYNVPEGPQVYSFCSSSAASRDCDGNGTPDEEQILANPELDCNHNVVLDLCEPDCDDDGLIDECEISQGLVTDCNANALPDDCETYRDCNSNGVYDACDISSGVSQDCNSNGIPDECLAGETDCNNNGQPDECDVAQGLETDCDGNLVIDYCEFRDCNGNGLHDGCDIVNGLEADCNGNLIPDGCEAGRTIYVDDDAPGDPAPGNPNIGDPLADGSPEHPYDALQTAFASSACLDTVIVADGVYTTPGPAGFNFDGRKLILRSASGPANCIIDAQLAGRCFSFENGETDQTVVDGFTIRNGNAGVGGAITCTYGASPTIRNCVFQSNSSAASSGVVNCFSSASPLFENCHFTGNSSPTCAGVFSNNSSPTLRSCTFESGAGRALYVLGGAPLIESCLVRGHGVSGANNPGGAAYISGGANATLRDCGFIGNSATSGGGALFAAGGNILLRHCTFTANAGGSRGGAVFLLGATISLDHSILWGNTATLGAQADLLAGATLNVRYCDVQGGQAAVSSDGSPVNWNAANIETDPAFAAAASHALAPDSPCINAGDPLFIAAPGETDLDGEARELGNRVDIGADEFGVFVFGDMNCDGVLNVMDINAFVLAIFDGAAYAAEFPECGAILADLDGDGSAGVLDINPFVEALLDAIR
ncbi:Serine protease AprX [Phycisphaerae bacterium RAS1]|nr:Serine protease AprX [Phycisphaerae bacterium RAS1]